MNILKSLGIVFVGFIVTTILSMGTDTVLENTGVFPTIAEQQQVGFKILWMNLLAIGYRFLFTIVGGYVVVNLSRENPLGHVKALGVLGTIVAIIGNIVVSILPATQNVLPLWFMIVLVLMAYPGAFIGGTLGSRKL
jgi:hypothetical protein